MTKTISVSNSGFILKFTHSGGKDRYLATLASNLDWEFTDEIAEARIFPDDNQGHEDMNYFIQSVDTNGNEITKVPVIYKAEFTLSE